LYFKEEALFLENNSTIFMFLPAISQSSQKK